MQRSETGNRAQVRARRIAIATAAKDARQEAGVQLNPRIFAQTIRLRLPIRVAAHITIHIAVHAALHFLGLLRFRLFVFARACVHITVTHIAIAHVAVLSEDETAEAHHERESDT